MEEIKREFSRKKQGASNKKFTEKNKGEEQKRKTKRERELPSGSSKQKREEAMETKQRFRELHYHQLRPSDSFIAWTAISRSIGRPLVRPVHSNIQRHTSMGFGIHSLRAQNHRAVDRTNSPASVDLVKVFKDNRDISNLTQCLEDFKSLSPSCDVDYNEVRSLL